MVVFDGKPLSEPIWVGVKDAERELDPTISGSIVRPLKAVDTTTGHRFLAPDVIQVKDFADYRAKLNAAKVMLEPQRRRELIETEARALAAQAGFALRDDPGLLDEVTGLVEWPVAMIGDIDPEFMDLPDEVLVSSMRYHQKYFSCLDADGNLAPKFIVVAATEASDGGAAIIAGNERVLRARLADAKFFWDTDRKKKLNEFLAALQGRVFHAKLGSVAEKVTRIGKLAGVLAKFIPGCDAKTASRAAAFAKADLSSEMVGEFPELQGTMGRYYALADGEKPEIADAIRDHYAPAGPNDACPSAPVSIAVALADKIDTLTGFFSIDEKPTGSKDPFALRRAALGVIRLISENGLRVSLKDAFKKAQFFFDEMPSGMSGEVDPDDLLAFFADRLKVHLKDQGTRHDLIDAVFALGDDDLVRVLARVEALDAFLATGDGEHLLTAFKRAANILRIEEKKDKKTYEAKVAAKLLEQKEEKDLDAALGDVEVSLQPVEGHRLLVIAHDLDAGRRVGPKVEMPDVEQRPCIARRVVARGDQLPVGREGRGGQGLDRELVRPRHPPSLWRRRSAALGRLISPSLACSVVVASNSGG